MKVTLEGQHEVPDSVQMIGSVFPDHDLSALERFLSDATVSGTLTLVKPLKDKAGNPVMVGGKPKLFSATLTVPAT